MLSCVLTGFSGFSYLSSCSKFFILDWISTSALLEANQTCTVKHCKLIEMYYDLGC